MPLILTPLPNSQHQYLFEVARQCGRKLNIVAEAESMTGLMALVDRGLGLGVLPFSAASLVDQAHPVATCEIHGFYSWRTLVRRADVPLSPAGQKAWDMIISEVQALSAAGIFGMPVDADQPAYDALPVLTKPDRCIARHTAWPSAPDCKRGPRPITAPAAAPARASPTYRPSRCSGCRSGSGDSRPLRA